MRKNIFKLRTPKANNSIVLINYNIAKERVVLSTKINIPTNLWNAKKNRLKIIIDAYPIAEVNLKLDEIDNFVNATGIKLLIENKLTKANLIEAIKERFNYKNKLSFFEWLALFQKEIAEGKRLTVTKKIFEKGSLKTFKSTALILIEYNKKLDWSGLNYPFYELWLNWLTVVKGYKPSNIVRHFKRLRGLLNVAILEGMPVNTDYKKWKVGNEPLSEGAIALTEAEIMEMENLKFGNSPHLEALDRVRDLFLVGVYSGQRFSDYSILNGGQIVNGFLEIIQIKTKAIVVIPVNDRLQIIMNKYNNKLPDMSNQKFNSQIKKVAALCPLLAKNELLSYIKAGKHVEETVKRWQLVSSHTARRTFASLAFERAIPSHIIMSITGHKTEKSFMKYIKTTKEKKAEIFKSYDL